ncbi:tetraacyldisaccharide 4'-kinase, partial [bacterium]|nr:tetraacyldisaccharide 4'-kinase [bacterium]
NIYLGGTGKTPTSILIAAELKKINKNPVILRKYYKEHIDEHELIRKKVKNLILCKNRIDGIKEAKELNFDGLILDDGFQDYKIKKSVNILCFNQKQLIGNGLVLPFGPLRESLSSLKNADIILINGKKDARFEKKIFEINRNLQIFYSYYKAENIDQFKNKKLLAIAGIGNPNNFFQLVEENGLEIEKKLIFPDHYEFSDIEITNLIKEAESNNHQIIMTEKDYFKMRDFNNNRIDYLKVSLNIKEKKEFINSIMKFYDQKN